MPSAVSPLVTRGFGGSPALIGRGFVATLSAVVTAAEEEVARRVKHGRTKAKELYEENFENFLVRVALTSVNNEYLSRPIVGKVEKKLSPIDLIYEVTEIVVRYIKLPGKKILITIKRIARGGM